MNNKQPRRDTRSAELIIFKYFKHLKLEMYFAHKKYYTETILSKKYTPADIVDAINKASLNDAEADNLIYWGMKQRRPYALGTYPHSMWINAIKKIDAQLQIKGILK